MKKIIRISILLLTIVIFLISCDIQGLNWDGNYYVKYSVTGSASTVDITIENESGGTSQFSDVALPWEYSFKGYAGTGTYDYLFVYVSAQNQGSTGTVTATILYKKDETDQYQTYKTSTSSGAYVIASAYGGLDL